MGWGPGWAGSGFGRSSPLVNPDIARGLGWQGRGIAVNLAVFLLAVSPDKTKPSLEKDGVLLMKPVGREAAKAGDILLLMGKTRDRQVVQVAVEVIGTEEIVLGP